jgi:hypothetical protein
MSIVYEVRCIEERSSDPSMTEIQRRQAKEKAARQVEIDAFENKLSDLLIDHHVLVSMPSNYGAAYLRQCAELFDNNVSNCFT